jgi:hypothetical protein
MSDNKSLVLLPRFRFDLGMIGSLHAGGVPGLRRLFLWLTPVLDSK